MSLQSIVGATLAGPKIRRSFDVSRGWSTTYEYEGTSDAIRGLIPALVPNYNLEVDETSAKATLIVRTPDSGDEGTGNNEILATQFELQANTSQRSGYEHWRSLVLGTTAIKDIKDKISGRRSPTIAAGDATTLYESMINGQDSFISSEFVFRISQYISRTAIVNIAFSNTRRVYSSASLISETRPEGVFPQAINEAYSTVLTDQYNGSVPSGHTLGWLKQAPTITTIAGNKQVVTVEYWLEAWKDYYYA